MSWHDIVVCEFTLQSIHLHSLSHFIQFFFRFICVIVVVVGFNYFWLKHTFPCLVYKINSNLVPFISLVCFTCRCRKYIYIFKYYKHISFCLICHILFKHAQCSFQLKECDDGPRKHCKTSKTI